jgi:hypothetical protein
MNLRAAIADVQQVLKLGLELHQRAEEGSGEQQEKKLRNLLAAETDSGELRYPVNEGELMRARWAVASAQWKRLSHKLGIEEVLGQLDAGKLSEIEADRELCFRLAEFTHVKGEIHETLESAVQSAFREGGEALRRAGKFMLGFSEGAKRRAVLEQCFSEPEWFILDHWARRPLPLFLFTYPGAFAIYSFAQNVQNSASLDSVTKTIQRLGLTSSRSKKTRLDASIEKGSLRVKISWTKTRPGFVQDAPKVRVINLAAHESNTIGQERGTSGDLKFRPLPDHTREAGG